MGKQHEKSSGFMDMYWGARFYLVVVIFVRNGTNTG